MAVIEVEDLRLRFGEVEAVAGVSLEVHEGEVLAFLGPNGAGKTTTVEILEGLRRPTSGAVRVLGAEPARGGRRFRERIGIVLQGRSLASTPLTVREMLRRHARFYPRPMADDRAIELVGLQEEAQRLADRVAIIRAGRIVADGTPAEIGTARAPARIRFLLPPALDGEPLPAPAGRVEREGDRVVVHTSRPTADAHLLTGWAAARGVELPELTIERPSLEEAYLALTESDNGAVR